MNDAETARCVFFILERTKYLVEPAAACCLAAAEQDRDDLRPDEPIVLLLCGGNVAAEDLATWRQEFRA